MLVYFNRLPTNTQSQFQQQ